MIKRILVSLAIGLCLISLSLYVFSKPPAGFTDSTEFVISSGESVKTIAKRLKAKQLIQSQELFLLSVWVNHLDKKLQAGTYILTPDSVWRFVYQLTNGKNDFTITFLEGWRVEEFAQEMSQHGYDSSVFIGLAQEHEGFLWPDTYTFPRSYTAQQIVNHLTQTTEEHVADLVKISGFERNKFQILASLLEREGKTLQDKQTIASVLVNRLALSMPLQLDATVQYAKDSQTTPQRYWNPITKADLVGTDSLFNTYLYTGLPPAPICNPGIDSVKAVANPAHTAYLYYLTGTDGKTYFSQTLEEHNQNIQQHIW